MSKLTRDIAYNLSRQLALEAVSSLNMQSDKLIITGTLPIARIETMACSTSWSVAASKGVRIATLPTGQGLLIKA